MEQANHDTWHVLDHGPIEQLAENLWRVKGTLPGISMERVMTLVRRDDGTLVIHSAIALAEPAMQELEALGEPRYLIVPNQAHRLDAPGYVARYPNLDVFAPRGARPKVEELVPVHGCYSDFPADDSVRLEMLHGVDDGEGAMIVRSADGITVVLNDCVFDMDTRPDLLGRLFTSVVGSAPGPRVSRLAKLLFIKDQHAVKEDLERYAAMPDLARVIVSHDHVSHGAAARETLYKAASYLS